MSSRNSRLNLKRHGGACSSPVRVLAVVDDVDTLSLVQLAAERAGHTLLSARSCAAATRLLDRFEGPTRPVDIAIAGVTLPDGDGVALLVSLQRRLGCPVIVICDTGGKRDVERSVRAGVDAYVLDEAVASHFPSLIDTLTSRVAAAYDGPDLRPGG